MCIYREDESESEDIVLMGLILIVVVLLWIKERQQIANILCVCI